MLEGHHIQITGSIHAGSLTALALSACSDKAPRVKSQFTSAYYSNMPRCLTNITQEYGGDWKCLQFRYARAIMDHRGGHTLSTLGVPICPSMTSCQYSDTPVSLTVFAKCIADSGRNTSSIITINREHDQDTGLRFRQAPYPDRNTGNGDCISVKYSNTSHV